MSLLLLLPARAAEQSITIKPGDFGTQGSYLRTETKKTISNVEFGVMYVNPNSGQIQKGNFYLYNTGEMPGVITKVVVTEKSGTFTPSTSYLNLGDKAISGKQTTGSITGTETSGTPKTVVFDVPVKDQTHKYFNLSGNMVTGTSCITNVIVYYTAGSKTDVVLTVSDAIEADMTVGDVSYLDVQCNPASAEADLVFSSEPADAVTFGEYDSSLKIISYTAANAYDNVRISVNLPSDKYDVTGAYTSHAFAIKAVPLVPEQVVSDPVAVDENISLNLGNSVTFSSTNASKLDFEVECTPATVDVTGFNGQFAGSSHEFKPVAEGEYIVTVTPVDEAGAKLSDKALFVTVTVTKVAAPLCGNIVFSLAGGEVKAGTVVTVSCENAAMIKYTVNGGEVNTAEGDSFDYTVNEASAIKAWGVNADGIAGAEAVVNYTIKQSASTVYTLVTDVNDIADGDKVLVVTKNGKDYYAMTNSLLSSKITSNSVTVKDGVIELKDGQDSVEVFTVEEGADSYAEKYALKGTKGYVTSTSSTNTSFGTSAYYSDVKITADGVTTWYVNSTRVLSGYSGKNGVDFRAYQPADAVLAIYLFREGVATPKAKVTLGVKEGVNAEIGVGETLAAGWLSATVDGVENAEALAAVTYSVTEGAGVVTVAADGAITAGENPGTAKVTATIANNKLFELASEPVVLDVTVVETKCKAPVLKVGETVLADNAELTVGDVITITTATEGAALFYSTQNGPDHEYDVENGLKLGAGTYTITATAKKEGLENASVTLTGVEVSKKAPEIGFADAERTVYLSDFVESREITEHEFINRNNLSVVFKSSDPKVASIDENTGDIHFWNKGVTTISAEFAGNDEYEAATVDYKLNVNLTRPVGESFTLEFTMDPTGSYSNSGTDMTTSTAIADVLKTGADKVESFTDFAYAKYNSRLGLRMGTNNNPGRITINFPEVLRITQLKAYVAKWRTDNVTFLLINDKRSDVKISVGDDKEIDEQERTYNYDVPMEADALTLRTIDTSYEEVQSPSKRIFIKALDITVESGLNAPVPFDESGNVIPRTSFNGVETDFIRFEHEAGVDIFYRYTAGEAGDPSVKPSKAPARAGEAAETATHPEAVGETFTKLATDASVTDKTTGKYYPYGENYEQWQGGVLKVFAQKTAGDGTVQRSPIHTFNLAIPTSVEGIEAEGNGEVEYFNLQGVKVQNPEKGIYIRVQDGKAVKIAK